MVVIYGDAMDDEVFKDHVGKFTVKAIGRTAKDRRPGALGYAEAMLIAYNAKCKYRLSMKKLYGKNSDEEIDDVDRMCGNGRDSGMFGHSEKCGVNRHYRR